MIDNLKGQEELEVKKLKVTKAEIVVRGTIDKPYYVIVYHEVGKDYDNEGFGSYYLENVFKWRNEELEIVDEKEQPQADKWIPCKPDKPLEEDENCVSKEFLEECKEVAKKYKKPMTNADRIRNMSDEELAEFMAGDALRTINCCDCDEPESEYGSCIGDCKNPWLKWLQAEVKEGADDE